MSDYATKKEVQEIVDKAVTDLSEVISGFAKQVDTRFNKLETKVDKLELKVDALGFKVNEIEARLDEQEKKFDRLLNTIDAFIGRIDRYETEQLVRDGQFSRLLEWARKVSQKTGIPLEDL
jgi:peptidoglycan hydrolase CwlO-like protein